MLLYEMSPWIDKSTCHNFMIIMLLLCQILGTVQNILKLICPSYTFNLELLFSELSVHNSWLFNDTIWYYNYTLIQVNRLFASSPTHCILKIIKTLRLKTENIKRWVVTCRMCVPEIGSVPEGGSSENWTPGHTRTHAHVLLIYCFS